MNNHATKRTEICELMKKFYRAYGVMPDNYDTEILMDSSYLEEWMVRQEEKPEVITHCLSAYRLFGCVYKVGDFDYDLMIRYTKDHSRFVIVDTTSEVP